MSEIFTYFAAKIKKHNIQWTFLNIAYKAAKIVVSELKKCEEPQLEMVPVSVAAKILGISEDHMRRIKDKFPHIKNGNNKQGRLLFVRDALLKEYAK